MVGFHIDMNMAHYRVDYLKKWLKELARLGFDTIVWEVENSIVWETCPECVAPDALSKETFREILAECRDLGLEPVPLFQTIGHAEYVLRHEAYQHLRELPGRIDQYCPRHPALLPFLQAWIQEYLDLFDTVTHFHLGADEAWSLGTCPKCSAYAAAHSLSQLYVDHVNAVAGPLIDRGITPIIWADMVLHHNEALESLSRDIMLHDWMYDIYRGSGKVWVWGQRMRRKEDLTGQTKALFGPYLFPDGDEPGREPETFYTADFLADKGFRVVTCPSSSSYGDNVFSPRNWLHLANTFDSFRHGLSGHLYGSVLTSWSVRLHPWELQLACISAPSLLRANPCASIEDFQVWFARERFGSDGTSFWKACGLLSKSCLFSHSGSLGYGKAALPVVEDHVQRTIAGIRAREELEEEIRMCQARQMEYRQSLRHFETFARQATRGREYVEMWQLAARNLINRAQASILLLAHAEEVIGGKALSDPYSGTARDVLLEMRALREETDRLYRTMIRPVRRRRMISYMYDAVEKAIARLATWSR